MTRKLGKDAAHESMYRIIPVSRSVVEARLNVSSVLLPQATILILNLLGLMVKTAFAGSSMYLWPVDLAFHLISYLCSAESLDGASVGQVVKLNLSGANPFPMSITSAPQHFIGSD